MIAGRADDLTLLASETLHKIWSFLINFIDQTRSPVLKYRATRPDHACASTVLAQPDML